MLLCKTKAEISVRINNACYELYCMGVKLTICSYVAIHELHVLAEL